MSFSKSSLFSNLNHQVSKRLKQAGTFPTLEIRTGHSRGNSSNAKDPEYVKVLEGSKHYSNYYLEHPELVNKVRCKSLVKRLIGYHKHSIDIGYVASVLQKGVSKCDASLASGYDVDFIRSMFTLLNLQENPTAEEFVGAVFSFLVDSGASDEELLLTFLKQLNKNATGPQILGKKNRKLVSHEAVYLFENCGLDSILIASKKYLDSQQAKHVDSILERIKNISRSRQLLEVDLGFRVNITPEERAYRKLSCYKYFQIANEAQRAVYVRRYITWCSSYASFGSRIAWYLSVHDCKDIHVARCEVIENYIKTGSVFPTSLDWEDFLNYLPDNAKLISNAKYLRGVHD